MIYSFMLCIRNTQKVEYPDFTPATPEAPAPTGGFAPETPTPAPAAPAKEVPYGGNFNFPSDFGSDFGSGFFGG